MFTARRHEGLDSEKIDMEVLHMRNDYRVSEEKRGVKPQSRTEISGTHLVTGSGDMLIACIDMGACNFSNLSLINITEIMSI